MVEQPISIGEFTFECFLSGQPGDELVFFLHGFPETAYMWRHVQQHISGLGYFCVAPNLRGYSKHACPGNVKEYAVKNMVKDTLDIVDSLGYTRFHLVGHDFGAFIGWQIAYYHPDRLLSWNALSVPHPSAFIKAFKTDPVQRHKSKYIRWLMIPYFSEWWLRRNQFALLKRLWKRSSEDEVKHYIKTFSNKASLTGALNYYRANFGKHRPEKIGIIRVPTQFIWGNRDLAVSQTAAYGNDPYIEAAYEFVELSCGHWLVQENLTAIKKEIRKHITKNGNDSE